MAVHRLGGDLFVAGGDVTAHQPATGDLIVGGGSVAVDAAVAGDTVAACRWLPERAGRMSVRIAATAAALLALSLLGRIPGLGALVGFLALLSGLGALVLQFSLTSAPAA